MLYKLIPDSKEGVIQKACGRICDLCCTDLSGVLHKRFLQNAVDGGEYEYCIGCNWEERTNHHSPYAGNLGKAYPCVGA
eukprot:11587971-Ditylum_brightwellii.AAC.1